MWYSKGILLKKRYRYEVEYVKWLDDETINKLIGKGEFREGNIEGYQYLRERTETAILKL